MEENDSPLTTFCLVLTQFPSAAQRFIPVRMMTMAFLQQLAGLFKFERQLVGETPDLRERRLFHLAPS